MTDETFVEAETQFLPKDKKNFDWQHSSAKSRINKSQWLALNVIRQAFDLPILVQECSTKYVERFFHHVGYTQENRSWYSENGREAWLLEELKSLFQHWRHIDRWISMLNGERETDWITWLVRYCRVMVTGKDEHGNEHDVNELLDFLYDHPFWDKGRAPSRMVD